MNNLIKKIIFYIIVGFVLMIIGLSKPFNYAESKKISLVNEEMKILKEERDVSNLSIEDQIFKEIMNKGKHEFINTFKEQALFNNSIMSLVLFAIAFSYRKSKTVECLYICAPNIIAFMFFSNVIGLIFPALSWVLGVELRDRFWLQQK